MDEKYRRYAYDLNE